MIVIFEEKIDIFTKGTEMKKDCTDYKKYCEEESYNAFSNKAFRLGLRSVRNKFSTTKKTTHHMYYLIKENTTNKYQEVEIEVGLYDITYDY
jgi:hypothetical protein